MQKDSIFARSEENSSHNSQQLLFLY